MRKLFRFKYEPCNGMCYAWCATLSEELMKLDEQDRQDTVDVMVKAHAHLCDNPNYSFGVDLSEKTRTFVAHFRTPEATDTFCSDEFRDCVKQVCEVVLNADIPKVSGDCVYGDNGAENLGEEILRACTDLAYREEHHKNCPCHN